MLKSTLSICAAAALAAGAGAPLMAQEAAPAQPTKEQVENAAYELRVFVSALQADKVDPPAKEALFQCIYGNSFAKISDAVSKVAAQNVGKFDHRNPDQVLAVLLGVCGFRPQAAEGAAGSAPATPPAQGR